MNLLLVEPGEVGADGTARLDGRRAAHVLDVLRAAPGARLAAGVLGGRMGEAEVRSVEGRSVRVALRLDRDPPPPSPVSILLAMPRPKALRRLLGALAAAGVKRIVLIGSWRVEKAYFGSPLLAPEALAAELRLGLEQGRDTAPPEVRVRRLFKPFVEDELDALFPDERRLLADEGDAPPLDRLPRGGARRALLAVGPEGGFTPYEAGALRERGFDPFSLGPRALRSDAATLMALGQVELWLRGPS